MKYRTRQDFYKSKQWEAFRKVIIDERTDADGFVHCAVCGEPILKKYDLIVHHKHELDEVNVNDAMVSLNPDNVECVHFKCHNKIHERFGYNKTSAYKPISKRVYIVYGSPASGKTTWVKDNATPNDLIVDMDSIWQMIGNSDRYDKPNTLKSVAFELRDKLYDVVKYRSGKWHNAYVITTGALKGDRDRLVTRVGADELIYIDTSLADCIDNINNSDMCDALKEKRIEWVHEWFERFQPDE